MITTTAPSLTLVPGGAAWRPTVALLTRARTLQAQARLVNPLVAQAYRRRAAQLRAEAHAAAGRPLPAGPTDAPAAA